MITLRSLHFSYHSGHPVFSDFNWSVNAGEMWAILGPSGCGKTTLLYILAGLRAPERGEVMIHNQRITRPRPQTGLILQDYGLLPWATVRDNVMLGLNLRRFYGPDGRHAPANDQARSRLPAVQRWLDRLGLTSVADRYPGQISGGQRQRAAIARTLVLEPDLLLMDEPFASLDAPTREGLQTLLLELRAEQNITTIIVTHAIEEAAFLGRKILALNRPPITEPVIVDNPHAGERNTPGYLDMCARLRSMLDSGAGAIRKSLRQAQL
ncbi:MAG: ABC transporter ATP-binding protein [Chloroflexi bacterium]|nr:ABC transporter ATP-binding protein [Chloroflexota bacterium]